MAERNHGRMSPAKRTVGALAPAHKTSLGKARRSSKTNKHKGGHVPRIPAGKRTVQKQAQEIITYVLDTNVIMDAWDSLFAFHEHDVCILSQVWKEMDKHKKGHSDQAWNIRKAIRSIGALTAGKTRKELSAGIQLIPPPEIANGKPHTGKLHFDFTVPKLDESEDINLSLDDPDDRILMVCLALKRSGKHVVLITNDGGFRIKATVVGIEAEEYLSEAITGVVGEEDIVTGAHQMPEGTWEEFADVKTSQKGSVTEYKFAHPLFKDVHRNEFLVFPDGLVLRVMTKIGHEQIGAVTIPPLSETDTFGVQPRDDLQRFALTLLTDPAVAGVSLAGIAGSGKTYLALAAALAQHHLYSRIIVTRSPVGSDEDIGFLPGDEKEKMDPWMQGVYDNLQSLVCKPNSSVSERLEAIKKAMEKHDIQIKALNFMKGRSLENTIVIVDEAQDLTPKTLKMISTRIGAGSKIIFLGNVAQIDNTYVTEYTNGLSVFIRAFADSSISGHITLQSGQRSVFATEAEKRL